MPMELCGPHPYHKKLEETIMAISAGIAKSERVNKDIKPLILAREFDSVVFMALNNDNYLRVQIGLCENPRYHHLMASIVPEVEAREFEPRVSGAYENLTPERAVGIISEGIPSLFLQRKH
jgi:hypothetical protein